jgi:hypothetical protein
MKGERRVPRSLTAARVSQVLSRCSVEQGGDPCGGAGHDCGLSDVDGPALQEAGTLPPIKPVLLRALDSHGRTGGVQYHCWS